MFDILHLTKMEMRGTRRRSTSLGEGDGPNSIPNVPQASSSDRFASVNLIAFDEDVPAGQLVTRI